MENAINIIGKWEQITLSAIIREKEQFVLTVSDTGEMSVGIQEKIFRCILRVDKSSREVGGVGLELAMVREVVRVHDGTIEVYK